MRVIASLNGQSMSTLNHYARHYNRIGVETGLAAVQQTLTKTLHRYSYEAKLTFDRFRTWVQECGAGNSNISEQKIVDVEGELFAAQSIYLQAIDRIVDTLRGALATVDTT